MPWIRAYNWHLTFPSHGCTSCHPKLHILLSHLYIHTCVCVLKYIGSHAQKMYIDWVSQALHYYCAICTHPSSFTDLNETCTPHINIFNNYSWWQNCQVNWCRDLVAVFVHALGIRFKVMPYWLWVPCSVDPSTSPLEVCMATYNGECVCI